MSKVIANVLPLTVFSIVSIAVFSGLSATFTVAFFMLTSMILIGKNFRIDILDHKLEFAFFSYLFISAYFGLNAEYSFLTILKIFALLFFTSVILSNIHKLDVYKKSSFKSLFISIIVGLIILHLEIYTQGIITIYFKQNFQDLANPIFYLYFLDRGSSIVSIMTWVVVAGLLKNNKVLPAILLYFMVMATISITDSLASMVALAGAIIVFLCARYVPLFRNPIIVSAAFIASAIIMVSFAFSMNAREISDNNDFLKLSAKHRLMIWEYVGDRARENLITGVGIGNSRFIKVPVEDEINYEGIYMSPLPLHPHNVIMQVLLETGVIGLVFFLLIATKYIIIMGKNYNSKDKNVQSIVASRYACLATFYVIAMISFNFWHGWWLSTAAFAVIAMSWFTRTE